MNNLLVYTSVSVYEYKFTFLKILVDNIFQHFISKGFF